MDAGYDVVVVDNADGGQAVEDVGDVELGGALVHCAEVVYVAEDGNRDHYLADGALEASNNQRFACFARRVKALGVARSCAVPRLSYIGGSWTKREPTQDCGRLLVNDASTPKTASLVPYEQAKVSAEANAQALAHELGISVVFLDWASVVPNFSSNFTISRMAAEAFERGTITYSHGDYGRPLLHRRDAGRALLAAWRLPQEAFRVVLLPGLFTPFETFAEVVRLAVAPLRGEVELCAQAETPEALRCRSESACLTELGFEASQALVREGLEETCRAVVQRLLAGTHGAG